MAVCEFLHGLKYFSLVFLLIRFSYSFVYINYRGSCNKTWGEWTGDPNMYSSMKYSGGQGCWNGPSRSAVVNLSCGSSNELVGATEPSRCEYHMEFKTPAACQKMDEMFHQHEHGGEL